MSSESTAPRRLDLAASGRSVFASIGLATAEDVADMQHVEWTAVIVNRDGSRGHPVTIVVRPEIAFGVGE